MRTVVWVAVVVLSACQGGGESESETSEPGAVNANETPPAKAAAADYAGDIERICNAEQLSGADQLDEGARSMHVAQWLGGNIKTEDGRQFLASLARAKAGAKVELLNSQAAKLGLDGCALAKAWSGGGQSTP
ncbi:MAG: hypothetical protein KJO07_22350 [Deltaproteobacteria bacterium]|jgi:hypothetical protein|nr:hypothetical protein [Deltaproteobacteria bacterium]